MRLEKIKISGFKSFVDPTTITLPSNLVGVVGPNGCGKSNIIDAVRWVMGESSAKHLRGDSMADVIFNGSVARKPVGQASIELIFGNQDGKLGGQFANYSEIAIKRLVSRDGQSLYFLNGTRCRRRDITDIFLGTGLGTRSYAIIEQGTITRLIEAKPDELRVILEEAAGISKYKERRRETENRLRHTRENLDRLNDIINEVEKRLEVLGRQAKAAERYRQLKEQERHLRGELLALRWRHLDAQASAQEMDRARQETEVERCTAALRSVEATIEQQRSALVDANEHFNEVQGEFYAIGAEITRLEQAIKHGKEKKQRQEQDLEQLERNYGELRSMIERDQQRIETLKKTLAEAQPTMEQMIVAERQSTEELYEAEEALQTWQASWDEFNEQLSVRVKTSEVEQTRIHQLQLRRQSLLGRRERLLGDVQSMELDKLEGGLEKLNTELTQIDQELGEGQWHLSELVDRIKQSKQRLFETHQELDAQRSRLQSLENRHASLTALQDVALGKKQEKIAAWLREQSLDKLPRLLDSLEVERGWEQAIETALGHYMDAICVTGIDSVTERLDSLPDGTLGVFDTNSSLAGNGTAISPARLVSKVNSPWPLDALIGSVYCVETLGEALAQRTTLTEGESVITRDGVWLGKGWLRVSRHSGEVEGVIERKNELERVETELSACSKELFRLQNESEQATQELADQENLRDAQQQRMNEITSRKTQIHAAHSVQRTRLEEVRVRHEQMTFELNEVEQELAAIEELDNEARLRVEEAQSGGQQFDQRRDRLLEERDRIRHNLAHTREKAQINRDRRHETAVRIQSMQTELDLKRDGLTRISAQSEQIDDRRTELNQELLSSHEPIALLGEELDELLQRRVATENRLSDSRQQVQQLDNDLRALTQERFAAEQSQQKAREKLEHLRLIWQESRVRCQGLLERGRENGYDLEEVANQLDPEAEPSEWEQRIERIDRHIKRLEPVNLAAIDEHAKESERKTYLDAQAADLIVALETLEDAIQRIDRESRLRFKETFDKVNDGIQRMFPRLFGGGYASLEMTGNDLLETGINIIARPPGKRNSTIHLLSGGEKALTAVALVFSIFELNPAPFCLLDEVDAPLDDANVARYCDLVREMSERIQFVFITHNKIAMEMADQVIGITMHEPGVSRLVTVDMEAAIDMANSNMAAAG